MAGELQKKFPSDLMETVVNPGAGAYIRVSDQMFTMRSVAHSASGSTPEYIGYANPGVGISASAWAVKFIQYNSSGLATSIQWAGGAIQMNQVFANFASLTYS